MQQTFGRESETLAPSSQRPIARGLLVLLTVGFTLRALWLAVGTGWLAAGTSLWLDETTANQENRPLASQPTIFQPGFQPDAGFEPGASVNYASTQTDHPTESAGSTETAGRLTASELMMLTSLCPTGVEALPTQLLPAVSTEAQKTGPNDAKARVAQADEISANELPATRPIAPAYRQTASRRRYDDSYHKDGVLSPRGRITGLRVAALPENNSSHGNSSPSSTTNDSSVNEGWLVSPEVWFGPDGVPTAELPPADASSQETSSTELAVTEPSVVEPSAVEPSVVEPSVVEPSVVEPSVTEPSVTEPSVTEPSVTEPSATEIEAPSQPTAEVMSPEQTEPALTTPILTPTSPSVVEPPKALVKNDALPNKEEVSADSKVEKPIRVDPLPASEAVTNPYAKLEADGKLESEQLRSEPIQPDVSTDKGPVEIDSEITPKPAASPIFSAPRKKFEADNKPADEPIRPQLPEIQTPLIQSPVIQSPVIQPQMTPPRTIQPSEISLPESLPTPKPTKNSLSNALPSNRVAPPRLPATGSSRPTSPVAPFGSPHAHDPAAAADARKAAGGKSAYESHRDLYLKNCYPSARDCAECHQKTYDEWSVSSHAYAYISPMFHKFEQKITDLSQGTVGHFCTRCHAPVTASMGLPRSVAMGELAGSQREGVTCIACHRVNERYGKTNGDRRIVPGSLEDPVYGGIGGEGVLKAIANRDKYKIKTSASDKKPGQLIHNEGRFFDQLSHAEACSSCHQVAVHPGIKLEVVWEQYRASPACKKGVTCQECHMGRIPGVAGGYNYGPIAEVGGKTVNDHRKQSNHTFYGPGYSIAHPGLFPQHKKADRWTIDEWLAFDWRGGWGTEDFEEQMEEAQDQGIDTARWFPAVWSDPDDRYDAREIIEDNQKKLDKKKRYRELVMENGSKVDGPFFHESPRAGQDLQFDYIVANLNEGHNLPTASLGAQPQLWANVVLIGPDGRRLWETGYTDSKGDLCDIHSEDVRNGLAPFDSQLFNLQTMFLITGATGTDREFPLPVNFSLDQVPQLRPGALPISVLNHPPFIRMESRSLAPLGKKRVKYKVPAELVCQPGRYRLSFRLRNRTEPMFFMRFCESTQEMMRSMTEGTIDIHSYSVEFEVR